MNTVDNVKVSWMIERVAAGRRFRVPGGPLGDFAVTEDPTAAMVKVQLGDTAIGLDNEVVDELIRFLQRARAA